MYEAKKFDWQAYLANPPALTDDELKELNRKAELESQMEAKAQFIENRLRVLDAPVRFKDKTIGNYSVTGESQKAYDKCVSYADTFKESRKSGRCAILIGMPGTGKTHLAIGMAKQIIENGHSVKYVTARGVIKSIRDSWAKHSLVTEAEVIQRLANFDLLIVDEIGSNFGTESEKVHFFDVIGKRYDDVKPTILIGNISTDEMGEVLGERVIDRMREADGLAIKFGWESYRKS